MASLFRRTFVLSISRFANQAILLLSPVLLVRILSIAEYGSYREFILYAGLFGPLVVFGVPHSLAYLLPKHPERETTWVTQTALLMLAMSSVAAIAIFLLGDLIRGQSSFDFVSVLQLYVIFFVNLDFVEHYWLGKKRTEYVLAYSTGRLVARIAVVIGTAFVARGAEAIVVGLVIVEGVRCLLVLSYALYKKWFTASISKASLFLQVSYCLPLGAGGAVETVNRNLGMLYISVILGAEALAFYVIGAFAIQIINILRGAIADVIFPEIVESRSARPDQALGLWRRATVWYCIMLFPAGTLFAYYSDVIVTILFTSDYSGAVPVFSAFALLLYLYCFDFHLPLRVQNANRYFLIGSLMALFVNLLLIHPLYKAFGLVGPAIAFVVSRAAMTVYLGRRVLDVYQIRFPDAVLGTDILKVLTATAICAPVLIFGKQITDDMWVLGLAFVPAYLAAYLLALKFLGVWDVISHARRMISGRLANISGRGSP